MPNKDTSLSDRADMHQQGMNAICSNKLLGDFKGQMVDGGYGSYMHDIFSYWRQYGIIAFFLLIIILMIAWSSLFLIKERNNNMKKVKVFAFVYLFYTTFGMTIAKSFVYTELYLALGIVFFLI